MGALSETSGSRVNPAAPADPCAKLRKEALQCVESTQLESRTLHPCQVVQKRYRRCRNLWETEIRRARREERPPDPQVVEHPEEP